MILLNKLVVGYDRHSVSPMINVRIPKGCIVAVIGPNGIGKSALLKTLFGLLSPISGQLEFIKKKPYISYLPQIKNLDYYFPLTVFDIVSMGCWPKISLLKKLDYHQKLNVWSALEQVDLLDISKRYIRNLSEGQLQRVLFARMIVQQASLILLDEPFQGIDFNICYKMLSSILKLCISGSTILIASHDEGLIIKSKYFSYVLSLTRAFSVWK